MFAEIASLDSSNSTISATREHGAFSPPAIQLALVPPIYGNPRHVIAGGQNAFSAQFRLSTTFVPLSHRIILCAQNR